MSVDDAHDRRRLLLLAALRLSCDALRISVLMTVAHTRSAVGKSGVATGHRRRLAARSPRAHESTSSTSPERDELPPHMEACAVPEGGASSSTLIIWPSRHAEIAGTAMSAAKWPISIG